MEPQRGSTQARSQLPGKVQAPIAVRADSSRSRWSPSLLPGAAPGSQDSGGIRPWPSSPPALPPEATTSQRHQESSDPTEVDPIRGEPLMAIRRPRRRQGRVEGGGDRSRVEESTTPGRRANRGLPPLASLNRECTASHERRGAETGAGRISISTRADTRAATGAGERTNRHPPGASPPQ